MLKRFLKTISTLLVLIMIVNMLPVQVLADEIQSSTSLTAPAVTEEAAATVVQEIAQKRTEYSKEFLLSNGMHMAVVYADPVHFERDGQWENIDNTLTADQDGSYINTAGIWDISFPQQFGQTQNVSISKDGYTLSFGMPRKLTGDPNVSVMSTSAEAIAQVQAATVTAVAETNTDVSAYKAQADYPQTVLDKLSSRITYENIHTGIDVVYDLTSNRVKESVILSEYDSTLRGFAYVLNTGAMIPELSEGGNITFYDETKTHVIMVMPTPFLQDAGMELTTDIQVDLTGQDGKYVLTYLLPQSWLASSDRQWPVLLDPVVQPSLQVTNVRDASVAEGTTFSYTSPTLETGYYGSEGKQRTYLKYENLPPLTSADTVVEATIRLYKLNNSPASAPVEVHKVLGDWASESITWSNKPAYDTTIEDFVICQEARYYQWDVTDIARQWYATGNNYGMLFKTSDAVENAGANNYKQFYSSDYSNYPIYMPTLAIYFLNSNGLESYWDYTASSAGRAGTGYVNDHTGNLVWVRSDMGFGGNRMPVTISHVYNANDAALNTFGVGYGWRTNYHQRVYQWDTDGDGTIESTETYYVWEDTDGTKHYFERKSDGTYQDEERHELTLTTTGTGNSKYIITDKDENTSHFDTQGRLTKLQNNQASPSSAVITYTSGNQISTITDGAGRVYAFTYSGGLLTRISFKGTGSTELSYTAFEYENGNLKYVQDNDGARTEFGYGASHLLTSAKDVDGYRIVYTYHAVTDTFAPHRVASIVEQDGTAIGGHITIAYYNNQTVFTDMVNNTSVTYQFNDWGNTQSVQDDEGRAQFMQFDRNIWNDETGKGNQLNLSSKLQNTVVNLLRDGSFELSTAWTPFSTPTGMTYSINTTTGYHGAKSMYMANCTDEMLRSTSFAANAGKIYSFSAYVKTTSGEVQLGIVNTADSNDCVFSEPISTNGEWTRVQVSYTNTGSAKSMCAVVKGVNNAAAYIDCIQAEEMPTASRFNLAQNSDFRFAGSGWRTTNLTTGDGIATTTCATPLLQTSAYKITGNYTGHKYISQDIKVFGEAGDSFTFSGWAMGNSVSLSEHSNEITKNFALRLTVGYTDGTFASETVQFNPNVDGWQFVAGALTATKAYSAVTIDALWSNNANTVYFDGLQVFKEEYGTTYTYDEDGNVISVTDLQNKVTTYEYSNNNLTKVIQDNKVKMSYTYDGNHNVTSATTEEGLCYNFQYDTYGNNTKVSITSGGQTISSEAVYTANGNLLDYTLDALGKKTDYSYNTNTGLLDWVQYPEDTEATRTEYTYDSMYRTATAAADTDSGLELSVSYGYTDDLLTSITTPSTTYNFTYGDFAQRTAVKVGTRTLASYSYESRTNRLTQLTYGNEDYILYTYDSHGRVTRQTYEDGETVQFFYDNSGNLATVTDSETGAVTTYYYDLLNRQVGYWEKYGSVDHKVTYIYNEDNNVESLTETINGTTKVYTYTYDEDNRITSMTVDGVTVTYTYDGFGRITSKQTAAGTQTVQTDSITYRTVGNATTSQVSVYNGTEYTYDDNGNILTVTDSSGTTSYVYDSANQLIRENNQAHGYTKVWTYDDAGNILTRTEYAYTTAEDLTGITPTDTVNYAYGNSDWGDLLTEYDGRAVTYDAIGNMIADSKYTYEWEHGRQWVSITGSSGAKVTMIYGEDGMRTGRVRYNSSGTVIATYTYVYNGSQLTQMTYNNTVVDITYDAAGSPLTMTVNGEITFYYVTNLQGDVIALLDETGTPAMTYAYDAWGNVIARTGDWATLNPLLYRGYVYDWETHVYYVSSRYYNPEIGRFFNADNIDLLGANYDFASFNLFAYCGNNPVIRKDTDGYAWETIWDAISLATSVVEVVANPYDPWAWIGLAGDAADVLIPFVGGIGETTRALKAVSQVVEVVDTASDAKKGWKIGEDITSLTRAGNIPSWSTLRSRYWKNKAYYFASEYSEENVSRMMRGLAPQFEDGAGLYSMELHHMLGRKGNYYYLFFEISPEAHAIVDPFRVLK